MRLITSAIGGICVPGCADYTRKQLDQLTDFVKRPQVGAKGLVYVKFNTDGTVKSSIDKFYEPEVWAKVKEAMGAKDGDLVLILSGDNANKTRVQLCTLRLEMGDRLGLRDKDNFVCLWIVDFPLFEWSDEEQRLMATLLVCVTRTTLYAFGLSTSRSLSGAMRNSA